MPQMDVERDLEWDRYGDRIASRNLLGMYQNESNGGCNVLDSASYAMQLSTSFLDSYSQHLHLQVCTAFMRHVTLTLLTALPR